jgi:Glutathione S-transferase, N-terminal domain
MRRHDNGAKQPFRFEEQVMNDLQPYTFKLCPYAHRVRLALAEKRLPAEHIEIDLKSKPAGFEDLSPNGCVPLLIHGQVKVWESAGILEYLDEAFPERSLMPRVRHLRRNSGPSGIGPEAVAAYAGERWDSGRLSSTPVH